MLAMKGFSLIELVSVLAIIAILVSIAYPSYQTQVQRTHRATVQGEMLAYAQAMERCFTARNSYISCDQQYTADMDETRYGITVENVTRTEFEIIATPLNAQGSDRCGILAVRQDGTMTAAQADCWY